MTPADLTVLQADLWFGAMSAARHALLLRDAEVLRAMGRRDRA